MSTPVSPSILPTDTGVKSPHATVLCLLTLISVLVFFPLARSEFISYDDPDYVRLEPLVTGGFSVSAIYQSITTYRSSNWHPVTWWSLMLDHSLFGLSAPTFHVHSLVLHILNGCLLFTWLRRDLFSWIPGGIVAVLFLIHPLHVEPVAWISSRKDLLSTFFFLCSLLSYSAYARNPRLSIYLVVSGFLSLGLMSKSMVITAPLVFLLVDIFVMDRTRIFSAEENGSANVRPVVWLMLEKVPLVFLCAGTSYLTYRAQDTFGAVAQLKHTPVLERLTHISASYAFYIEKTFLPINLSLHYPYLPELMTWKRLALSLFVISIVSWVALRPGHDWRQRAFGWSWYVVTLLPVCGLLRLGGLASADRYSYIPLIGLFITIAGSLPLAPMVSGMWRRSTMAMALAACIALGLIARHQVLYWHDSETVFRHAVTVTPNSARIQSHLGIALERNGKSDEAALHLQRAVQLDSKDASSRALLCKIHTERGQYAEALQIISEAAEISGAWSARMTQGQRRTHAGIYQLWGRALAATGDFDGAIVKYNEALSDDKSQAQVRGDLADALVGAKQYTRAAEEYRRVIAASPRNAKAKHKLAKLLCTCPDEAIRNPSEAIRLAREIENNPGIPRPELDELLTTAHAAQQSGDQRAHKGGRQVVGTGT